MRRCVGELADSDIPLGILPAGTANLLAKNLDIPISLDGALKVALHGDERRLDVGVMNGERFAVMAGTGFDALLIGGADRLKGRWGQLSYIWSGVRASGVDPAQARIKADGLPWFNGELSCLLIGNVSTVMGRLEVFPDARPDDGRLDVGVVQARRRSQWLGLLARVAGHRQEASPLVQTTTATRIRVQLDRPLPWEADGGDRKPTDHYKIDIESAALAVRVPPGGPSRR